MASSEITCPLRIDIQTLSALRDQALGETEAQQLRTHCATCPACRARLAGFDRVAQALRRQRDLEPGSRIWNRLQPALSHKERSTMIIGRTQIGRIIAIVSVLLLV